MEQALEAGQCGVGAGGTGFRGSALQRNMTAVSQGDWLSSLTNAFLFRWLFIKSVSAFIVIRRAMSGCLEGGNNQVIF